MEEDTERDYMEEVKKNFKIDQMKSSATEMAKRAGVDGGIPDLKSVDDPDEIKILESSGSLGSWAEDKAKIESALTSEERKKFLLDRHEKLTIENENLRRELEEIKIRIQSFRGPDSQQEHTTEE